MGKFVFIPAMITHLRNVYYMGCRWKGKGINPFTSDSIDPYNYLLVSAWWEIDWMEKKNKRISNYKEMVSDTVTVFGDSGGFQAESKGINPDVRKLSTWQMQNCDYYMGFDIPPDHVRVGNVTKITNTSQFKEKTQQTFENNLLLCNIAEEKIDNYYNVMQGITLERRDYFFDLLSTLPFQKYAVACRPSGNPVLQAFAVCHLHSKGITGDVHVLGVGGETVIPIFPYLKDLFNLLTIDSSSYGQGVITRMYKLIDGKNLNFGNKKNNNIDIDRVKIDGLPCNCNVCNQIDINEVSILWAEGSIGGSLITCHNLRITLDHVDYLNKLYDDLGRNNYKELIKQTLLAKNKNIKSNLFIALDLIDYYLETRNIEKVNYKYLPYIRSAEDIPKQYNSLF